MTVWELVMLLREMPPEARVIVDDEDGGLSADVVVVRTPIAPLGNGIDYASDDDSTETAVHITGRRDE